MSIKLTIVKANLFLTLFSSDIFFFEGMTKEVAMDPEAGERKLSVPIICHDSDGETPENKLFKRRRQLRESEGIQLNNLHPLGHTRSSSFRNRPRPKLLNVDSDRPRRSSLPSPSANFLSVTIDAINAHRENNGQPLQRVRSFKTTSKGGIINRGDSFKRSSNSINSQGSVITTENAQNRQRENSVHSKASSSDDSAVSSIEPTVYKVAMLGDKGVGKASLTNQFTTSEFVAFENDQGRLDFVSNILYLISYLSNKAYFTSTTENPFSCHHLCQVS